MARFAVPNGPREYVTTYARFRGVDFSTDPALVDASRSPFAPNLISDAGGMPEKRPGWRTLTQVYAPINGLYKWEHSGVEDIVIHARDRVYIWHEGVGEPQVLHDSLGNHRSQGFVMNGNLYILSGERYFCLMENEKGEVYCYRVEELAYVPLTSIGRKPNGGGTDYEACNMLTARRRNSFCCDGTSKNYALDGRDLPYKTMECKIDGEVVNNYQVDYKLGIIVFDTPPPKPAVAGRDNLEVEFTANASAAQVEVIDHCTICSVYAGCVFISGNKDKPAYDYRSARGDPTYFPDTGYTRVGSESAVMGYRRIGPYQAIIKAASEQEATVYLRQESTLNGETVYPVRQGVSGVGAISSYAFGNILDEPLFLAAEGVFGIYTSNVSEEKAVQNRSYYIDSALTKEEGLANACAAEWGGRYVLAVNNKCYLLDGTQEKSWRSQSMGDYLYECYHWENIPARCLLGSGGDLYFGTEDGRVCRFNTDIQRMDRYADDGEAVVCAWSTKADDDGLFTQYKSLSRRGCGVLIKPYLRSSVKVLARTEKDFGRQIRYATMDIFDWEDLDFSRVGFVSSDAPQVVAFNKRMKRYITLQITVRNDGLNEGFGVFGITKRYTKGTSVK